MSIAAIGALANSFGTGLGVRPVTPAFGVAFRFKVEIDGLALGDWQSCSGLKVDFKPVEMKPGGNYLGSHWLAGEATYSRIVLKRAAVTADSENLQAFLRSHSIDWLNGLDSSKESSCKITLFDSGGQPVMWWTLTGARPAAWSGPDLDAGSSKVAIETLELVHNGFSVGTPKGGGASSTTPDPSQSAQSSSAQGLTISESAAAATKVSFTYPPREVQVKIRQDNSQSEPTGVETVGGAAIEAAGRLLEASLGALNKVTYVLNDLTLFGPTTRADVERLTLWATKETKQDPNKPKGTLTTQTELKLKWGNGFNGVPVHLQSLSATYTRFTADGVPTRAKVTLTLEQCGPAPAASPGTGTAVAVGAMNPTSGGLPGRSSHRVLESESLPALAQETYGDAGRWRAIAEANRVDDPLRVRPGTMLLLPAASELDAGPGGGA